MTDHVFNFGVIASGSAYEDNPAQMAALDSFLRSRQNAFVAAYKTVYYTKGADKPIVNRKVRVITIESKETIPPNIEGVFVVQLGGEFEQIGGDDEDVGGGNQKLG